MKKTWMYTLAAGALALAPMAVNAGSDYKKVVHDSQGHIVKNTWDNCVITKWDAEHPECSEIDNELLVVYFAFDDAGLTPEARGKLDSLIGMLNSASDVESVDIVGFADEIGNADYNYNLSRLRAQAVQGYLSSRGIVERDNNVDVRAFGEDAPVSDCSGVTGEELKACLWRDRRVEIKLNFQR